MNKEKALQHAQDLLKSQIEEIKAKIADNNKKQKLVKKHYKTKQKSIIVSAKIIAALYIIGISIHFVTGNELLLTLLAGATIATTAKIHEVNNQLRKEERTTNSINAHLKYEINNLEIERLKKCKELITTKLEKTLSIPPKETKNTSNIIEYTILLEHKAETTNKTFQKTYTRNKR